MRSYTLSNWDGSQSRKQSPKTTAQNFGDSLSDPASPKGSSSIFPASSILGSASDRKWTDDATSRNLKSGKSSQGLANGIGGEVNKSRDIAIRRNEEGNQTANHLATLYSQQSETVYSRSSHSNNTRTTPSGRAQNQVQDIYISAFKLYVSFSILTFDVQANSSLSCSLQTASGSVSPETRTIVPAAPSEGLSVVPQNEASSVKSAQDPNLKQVNRQIISVHPPHDLVTDPVLLSVSHGNNFDDDYTSADAEGESVDDPNFEPLELPPLSNQVPLAPSASTSNLTIANPTTLSNDSHTIVSKRPTTHKESVYDLFILPPSDLPPQSSIHSAGWTASCARPKQFVCVEIPPLPPGKHKADYHFPRVPKRARRVDSDDDDTEYKKSEQQRLRREREGKRERERLEKMRASSATAPQTCPSSVSASATSGYDNSQQHNQEKKSVLSGLSMGRSNGTPLSQRTLSSREVREGSSTNLSTPTSRQRHLPTSLSLPLCDSQIVPTLTPLKPPVSSTTPVPQTREPSPIVSREGFIAQPLKVRSAQHPSATAVYFNTRFTQGRQGTAIEWALLGRLATMNCVKSNKPFRCDQLLDRGGGGEAEDNFSVGGPLLWKNCCLAEKNEALPEVVDQPQKDAEKATLKVDMAQLLQTKRKASAGAKDGGKRPRRDGNEQTDDRVWIPAHETPSSSQQTTTTVVNHTSPIVSQHQRPPHLSEKAWGKQRTINPDSVDIISIHPTPATTSAPTSTFNSPTNTVGVSYHASNPHDDLDRNLESYLAFSLSPEKSCDQLNGDSDLAGSSKFSTIMAAGLDLSSAPSSTVAALHDGNIFRSQGSSDKDNLFLPSHGLVSPVLKSLGVDSGIYSFDDTLDSFLNEGGKDGQLITTIDPAMLGGVSGTDDVFQDGGLELEFGFGGGIAEELKIDSQTAGALNLVSGYQSDAGSPIASPATSTSSLARLAKSLSPRSSPSASPSPPDVVGGTSSPEFSEYDPGQSALVTLQEYRSSHASSRLSSVFMLLNSRSSRVEALADDEDDDDAEEKEVQMGLVLDHESSDDDFVGSSSSEDTPPTRRPRRQSIPAKKKLTTSRTSAVLSKESSPVKNQPKQTAPRRKEEWPKGEAESYCHQCRRKTFYLKMTCLCGKKYCNRCVALRKRGEEYVSLRVTVAQAKAHFQAALNESHSPDAVRTPSPNLVEVLPPLPDNVKDVSGPFSFWGTIYDWTGTKFADGFAAPGDKVILANVVEGYSKPSPRRVRPGDLGEDLPASRVFIGTCQPSWGLGRRPIIKESGKRGRSRPARVEEYEASTKACWFVGKEHPLYWPVVAYVRDLPALSPFSDLSSLSSLSDGSDDEAQVQIPTPAASSTSDHTAFSNHIIAKISATSPINDEHSFDPNTISTKDTIRVLENALEACGMKAKIGDIFVDL
ncbi:hypothetical protein AN958_10739 [Leucoagaricus sp. SymC.cos]|nr:hypothetical protein AN958_10739 [Leucoagaricus sp. SymC.cos]